MNVSSEKNQEIHLDSFENFKKLLEEFSLPIRYIGKIKWFDRINGFGYIVTNNRYKEKNNDHSSKISEVRFEESGLLPDFTPKEDNWVLFEVYKVNSHKYVAFNIEKLKYTQENLFVALAYGL